MTAAVIYKSKYGRTKSYAEWIAQDLNCDVLPCDSFKTEYFERYDVIIFGGGLYAGGLNGIELITKNYDKIRSKSIVVFTCGLADPENTENEKHIRNGLKKVLNDDMLSHIKLFHLRGGIDYKQLGPVHKAMMFMLKKMLSGKDDASLTDEDRQLLSTYGQKTDFLNKNTISPLVEYVKSLLSYTL